jgi:hypothetical protein
MKKFYLPVLSLPLLIISCKSIKQKPFQLVKISTDKEIDIVAIGASDSAARLYKNVRGLYWVRRSQQPLNIKLKMADSFKTVVLKPGRWPAGLIAPGLQAFPSKVYIGKEDTSVYLSRYPQEKKGRLRYYFAPVLINNFSLHTPSGQYNNNPGILGFENGIDYFTKHNRYFSVFVGMATDVLPLPIDYFGAYVKENANTIYAGLRNNYVLGRFDVGYGVSFNYFKYDYKIYDTTYRSGSLNRFGFGPSLVAQFRFNNVVRIGVTYQPSLLDFKAAPLFNYQHFLSVNVIIKTPERRKRRIRQKYYTDY